MKSTMGITAIASRCGHWEQRWVWINISSIAQKKELLLVQSNTYASVPERYLVERYAVNRFLFFIKNLLLQKHLWKKIDSDQSDTQSPVN